ncbi:MAG: FtsH protease activity modulator HflK [bacterium]
MSSGDFTKEDLKKLLEPKKIIMAVIAVIIIFVLVSARQIVYTIQPEEQGIVLRFGKYDRTAGPGLHFKLPWGIENAYILPVERQLKQEFGFRTAKSDVRSQRRHKGYENESRMLTGDLNSAKVEWIVQYRITDPLKYLFNVRSVEDTFRDMSEAVMRQIVGDRSVDEVITWGKAEINKEAKEKLQELAEEYETGLAVHVVLLQNVNAPEPVQPSWNEVNEAEQQRDKLVNEAKGEYNKRVPRAKGAADRMIKKAEGYAIKRVNEAEGNAEKFTSIYNEYRLAPQVTKRRYYLETMADIIPKAGRKIIVDDKDSGVLKLLNLEGKGVQK